jgi:hypothetical protein
VNGTSPALWRLLRDVFLTSVGIFMLLHETLREEPRLVVFMVGLIVLAGPATIRAIVTAYFGARGKT